MIRHRALQVALALLGLLFLLGFYPLTQTFRPETAELQMFGSVYGSLGIFLLLAVRNPSAHRSLIAFTGWSSVIHGSVMALQVFKNAIPHHDLLAAVLPFILIGLVMIILTPAKQKVAGT